MVPKKYESARFEYNILYYYKSKIKALTTVFFYI
jgi:hypothetical protein